MATATKKKSAKKPPTELATTVKALSKKRVKSDDFLTDLRDTAQKNGKALDTLAFGDILKQLYDEGEILSATELGDGWAVLNNKEKSRLVGVPLLVLSWTFNEGDNGEFASLQVLTNNERMIVNDGSTGIYQQLKALSENGEMRAVYAKHGLRESKYTYQDPKTGEEKPASTFYIDTSA